MGMNAEIIAIGPFSQSVVDVLDYGSEYFKNTKSGSIITVRLFGMSGSSSSREFAKMLGISDPWDFNSHKIKSENINFEELKKFINELHEDYNEEFERFLILMENGFEFHFRPEG